MQKVLRRSVLVKRQAARKAAQVDKKEELIRKINLHQQAKHLSKLVRKDVRAERRARREDWFQGPLAPRRDVGEAAKTYGTVAVAQMRHLDKLHWRKSGIVEGDRVVVVKKGHPDQGKIGTVTELMEKAEAVVIKGLNKVDAAVPSFMVISDPDKTPFRSWEASISLSDVRLVAPLPHPETGIRRDVIINELELQGGDKPHPREYRPDYEDSPFNRGPRTRWVAGVVPRIYIPYPEKAEEETIHDDNDCDTPRLHVEPRTWTPTLRFPPMPSTLIDELRNKYSLFRTRHDDDYIAEKIAVEEAAKSRTRELKKQMLTPIQELNRKARAERRAKGKPTLTDEELSKIGEIMAKNLEITPSASPHEA